MLFLFSWRLSTGEFAWQIVKVLNKWFLSAEKGSDDQWKD